MGYHVVWDLDLPNRDADLTRLAFFFSPDGLLTAVHQSK